jgi:hypothetical protein
VVNGEIVRLAERLVEVDREAAAVRARLLKLLANGSGPSPRPIRAGHKPGARDAETTIVELLRDQALGPAAIARATGAKAGTVNDRLRRLSERGLVERGEGGWRATSSP